MKITIDGTEVLCSNDFTIKQEMLNTPSVILNNVYPKSWETDKDYTTNFYHPEDYTQCLIYDGEYIQTEIKGSTTQSGTPTPDNPVPIVNKTGTIQETIDGKQYTFDLGSIELCKIGNYEDRIFKSSGKNLFDYEDLVNKIQTFTISGNDNNFTITGYATYQYPISITTNEIISGSWSTTKLNGDVRVIYEDDTNANILSLYTNSSGSGTINFIPTKKVKAIQFRTFNNDNNITLKNFQIEKGSSSTSFEPYGTDWYVEKNIYDYDTWDTVNRTTVNTTTTAYQFLLPYPTTQSLRTYTISNYFQNLINNNDNEHLFIGTSGISVYKGLNVFLNNSRVANSTEAKNWLINHGVKVYYVLENTLYEKITDSVLLNQLNHVGLELIFCGLVKNSGQISLNPRHAHYSTLQILDYKDFLSQGETLDVVIADKTITQAINQVIDIISPYGFELGTVNILNPNDVIGAYSTKDKTAYDVFNYIADITQSRWTTRMIEPGKVAIDFYDPSLMTSGTAIDYTNTWFKNNKIIDISYNYGTWDYRNKQVMTSREVFGNIVQTQTIIYDGYATQIMTELPIGRITKITLNGVERDFATNDEKNIGIYADFYYSIGDNFFERGMGISAGSNITISYYPIVEGRQIVSNASEITRVANATGVKGIVARYENRNDAITSEELQKIGQSYIKYKGVPEIRLTVKSETNLWNVGQRVQFNAPIEDLDTEYMVKKKEINYIVTADTIFYTYELSSSFNSESAINYFDNQRSKANGNIKEGEYISRNVDLESTANIIFYDTTATTIAITGNNDLQSDLEVILGG